MLDRGAVGGEEDRRDRIGHPRRGIDLGEQVEATGRQAGLLDQLAARHLLGGLPLDVAHSGRDLEDRPLVGRTVLLDEHDRGVALGVEDERHHADRTGRPHDVTGESFPVGVVELGDDDPPHVALVDQPVRDPIGTSRTGSVSG